MLIKVKFSKKLTVENSLLICENKKDNVLTLLNKNYKGRCFNDVVIVNILEDDLYIGVVKIDLNHKIHTGTMNVEFIAECNPMKRGYRLVAEIENIIEQTIQLKTQHAEILIPMAYEEDKVKYDLSFVKPGYKLPIFIIDRVMPVSSKKVYCKGKISLSIPQSNIFIVTGKIDTTKLIPLINTSVNLQKELEKLKTGSTKEIYEFMEKFLYPYKNFRYNEIDKTKKVQIIDIARNIVPYENKQIIKDARINWCNDPCVIIDSITDKPPTLPNFKNTINCNAESLITMFLTEQIYLAELMIDMINSYNTPELIKKHSFVWELKGNYD